MVRITLPKLAICPSSPPALPASPNSTLKTLQYPLLKNRSKEPQIVLRESKFFTLCYNSQFLDAQALLPHAVMQPSCLFYQHSNGWTALHFLILFSAPTSFIADIVKAATPQILAIGDTDGIRPLHLAAYFSQDLALFKLLIREHPEALMLKVKCSDGVERRPVDIARKDENGRDKVQHSLVLGLLTEATAVFTGSTNVRSLNYLVGRNFRKLDLISKRYNFTMCLKRTPESRKRAREGDKEKVLEAAVAHRYNLKCHDVFSIIGAFAF